MTPEETSLDQAEREAKEGQKRFDEDFERVDEAGEEETPEEPKEP
jgi:hypothetical protein